MDLNKLRPLLLQLPLASIALILFGSLASAFRGVGSFVGSLLMLIGIALIARWCFVRGGSWFRYLAWAREDLPADEIACRDRLYIKLPQFLIARGAVKPLNHNQPKQGWIARVVNKLAEASRTDTPRIAQWASEPRGPVAIVSLPVGWTFEWFERERSGLADAWGVPSVDVQRGVPGYVQLVGVVRDPLEGSNFRGEAEALADPRLSADDFLDGRDV